MADRSRSFLAQQIYRRHLRFVREVNDIHIFVEQMLPLLKKARATYSTSSHKKDRRYYVPAIGRQKFARRTDAELRAIFDRFLATGIYEAFIVTAVSMFEALLMDVMRLVLCSYPKAITMKAPDVPSCSTVPIQALIDAASQEDAIQDVINNHVAMVMYAKPKAYLTYFTRITGVTRTDRAFDDYIEIKATRDLLVHNDAQINEVYVGKAGKQARGDAGQPIAVDHRYFEHVIANLKRLSGIIERDTNKKFPRKS